MLTKTKQIPTKLLERYNSPDDGIDKEVWQIADQKVTFNFLKGEITIIKNTIGRITNIDIPFEEIEILHKILNKEEIDG